MNLRIMHARIDKLDARLPAQAQAITRTIDLSRISQIEQKELERKIHQITVRDNNGNMRQNLSLLPVTELKALAHIIQKITISHQHKIQ